jgi:hypothetical protein
MEKYNEYLRDIISKKKTIENSAPCIVKAAAAAIDSDCGIKGLFLLVYLYSKECYLCMCSVDTERRFYISSLLSFNHDVKKSQSKGELENALRKFDHDMDCALEKLSLENTIKAFAYIPESVKSVSVTLKAKFKDIQLIDALSKRNLKSRTKFSDYVAQPYLIFDGIKSKITSCLQLNIYIPDEEKTLSSYFMNYDNNTATWRDILPENCATCDVAGVVCFYVKIHFFIDFFNNIFCQVADYEGHERIVHLIAPFGRVDTIHVHSVPQNKQIIDSMNEGQALSIQTIRKNIDRIINDSREKNIDVEGKVLSLSGVGSYRDVLKEYIKDVQSMVVIDRYIREQKQFDLLEELILDIKASSSQLSQVYVVTTPYFKGDKYKPRDKCLSEDQAKELRKDQLNLLKRQVYMRKRFNNIDFFYCIVPIKRDNHDRYLILDNGWQIGFSGGINIFNEKGDLAEQRKLLESRFLTVMGSVKHRGKYF